MTKNISDKEMRKFFDSAVDLIGKDWLDEKRRYYYSDKKGQHRHDSPPKVIQDYQRAIKDLNKEEDEVDFLFGNITESTIRFIQLGRFYENLSDSEVILPDGELVAEDIKKRYRDKLRNQDEFEKARFELQAAAGYARKGLSVDFIDEGEEKRPDLLVKSTEQKIFVECKKLDKSSKGDKKKKNKVSLLLRKTAEAINEESFIGLYRLHEVPSNSKIKETISELQGKNLQGAEDKELDFGSLKLSNLFSHRKTVKTPTAGQRPLKQYEFFFNTYVRSKLKRNFDIDYMWEDLTEEELSTGHVSAEIQERGISVAWRKPKFIAAKFPREENQVNQILSQFDEAYGKFGKEIPNILHIEALNLEKLDEENAEELENRIGGQLKVKSRISAVVLSTSLIDKKDDLRFKQPVKIIENYDPYSEINEKFFKNLLEKKKK